MKFNAAFAAVIAVVIGLPLGLLFGVIVSAIFSAGVWLTYLSAALFALSVYGMTRERYG